MVAQGSTQIIVRSPAICFLFLDQNVWNRNHHHRYSVWVTALSAYQHSSILKQMDPSGSEGPSYSAGSTHTWRQGGRDQEWAHVCSWKQSLSQPALTHFWKAAGPLGQSLIGKQQRFFSTAIYVSSAWQAVSVKWGSLNLLPFRLLPQSLTWQVISLKKHCMRVFPPLLFKQKQRERKSQPQRFKWLKWRKPPKLS